MSSNPLNDLSKVYLDQIANVKKAETQADIKRWEEIGGPTPTNYKPTGNSAKIKTEGKVFKSNWRVELNEIGDPDASIPVFPGGEKQAEKKVKEVKGIKNKIEINPKLHEVVAEIGGELIEAVEVDPQIASAVEYFYEEGINEEGIDQLIEEIGLEAFVDFVEGGAVELNEERAARRATVRAKKYDVVKKEVDKADAARKASKKGEYAPSYAKKETDVTVYDDKPAAKKKAAAPKKPAVPKKPAAPKKPAVPAKPAAPKKPVAQKVVKAVAKVKKTQPVKKPSKTGLADRIRTAYKAGVKRHRKATQVPRVFAKGAVAGAKKTVKFAKDVKKAVVGEATDAQLKAQEKAVFELEKREANANRAKALKKRKKEISEATECDCDCGQDPCIECGESHHTVNEDLKTREQVLQRKQLMLDRQKLQLRRRSQSMKNKEKNGETNTDAQANVIANESRETRDRALEIVRANIIKKHGKGAIYDPKSVKKPTEADKAKAAAERKKRQDADNKAFASRAKKAGYKNPQDYANVVARYGSEDNMKKGRGLGT